MTTSEDKKIKVYERHFILAAKYGMKIDAEFFLKKVNVNVQDDEGKTALIWSSIEGHKAILFLLFEHEVNINHRDNNGNTGLMYACEKGRGDFVKALIDHNADLNIKNNDGNTALMLASLFGQTK